MTPDTIDRFTDSARAVNATVVRTDVDGLRDAVAEAIEPPAVGVEPDIEGVSLEGLAVTLEPTATEVAEAETGITGATLGIADYGSVVIRETTAGEEPTSLFCERHVAVLAESAVVADMPTAFESFGEWLREGGDAVIATGPSATADMGSLVWGAHGPRELHVVVVEDR